MSSKTDRGMSVDTAMSRVLEAEKEALAKLAASERRANDILRDAREYVRALARGHQARISRLHADCAARNEELVTRLEQDAAVHDHEHRSGDDARRRLEAAVAELARELTGKGDAH